MEDDVSTNTGKYLLSNLRTYGTRRYHKTSTISQMRNEKMTTPGPGSYKPPSDFGYIELGGF